MHNAGIHEKSLKCLSTVYTRHKSTGYLQYMHATVYNKYKLNYAIVNNNTVL